MAHYNTGIKESIPSLLDIGSAVSSFFSDIVQLLLGNAQTSFAVARAVETDPGVYNSKTQSWTGKEGLSYRIPLSSIPSERRSRQKVRSVKLMMDSCRRICTDDLLPCTPEEKKFWYSYRFMKYQMMLSPACVVMPPFYIFWRVCHDKLPRLLRGRTVPIFLGLALAEQWAEATYPGHQFLSKVLSATTPMGDAARAEWERLQNVDIPFHVYTAYKFHHFFNSVPEAYLFGGDIASLCA